MGRDWSIDSAGDVCGELLVRGWVRPEGNVAEETEVESGTEGKSADPDSAACSASATTGFRQKNLMGKNSLFI